MLKQIVHWLIAISVAIIVASTILQLVFTGFVQEPCCWHSNQP